MCIIVDTNAAHDLSGPTPDGSPVLRWLLYGKGGLVVGGNLRRELSKSMRGTLVVLNRAGRLWSIDDGAVEKMADRIKRTCVSNDSHVLAVAAISGCRLIFTKDKKLHKDAKNKKLLDPPAAIYKSKAHQHLLTVCRCP
jgi:rRNA-processing protein FCF1